MVKPRESVLQVLQRFTKLIMDQATRDLLTKWNLTHYMERFEAERIDIATMQLLRKDDIISMFPQIGDRLRFEASLAMLKKDRPPKDMDNTFNSSLFGDILGVEYQSRSLPFTLDLLTPSGSSEPQIINLDSGEAAAFTNRSYLDGDTALVLPLDSSVGEVVTEASTVNNLVSTILNSSAEGRQIIEIGQKTGAVPSDVRGRLCKLLMEKLITAENPVLQTDSQLLTLSYDIGRLFKKESPPLYYAPYLPADAYQAKRNISGWLVTARRARRQYLVSLGLIEKAKSRSRSKSTPRKDGPSHAGIDLTGLKEGEAEVVESALEQLSHPSPGPWQEVSTLWRETVRARLRYLYYEEGTLQEYFNKYPILKSSDGWRLLTSDYEALFPDKSGGLDALDASSETIIKVARQKLNATKDKFLRQRIADTLAICDDEKPETKLIAAVLLIGCLFNIPPARRSKKDWQASRAEILDGFVTIVDAEADVQVTIEERRHKLQQIGITLQPFIIWCRESGVSFIVCDNTFYKFTTFTEAVDVTFKIFHATAAKYSTESYNIWIIIQIGFYKIKTPYDRLSQSVKETLVTLGVTI